MLDWKRTVILSCLLAATACTKKKDEGDGAIRIVMRGPPLPVLMQNIGGLLMDQYMKSFSMPGAGGYGQSRADYGRSYAGGGYPVGSYGGSSYGSGFHAGAYYFSPKRTGYNFGLGLGALKGLVVGSGSFDRLGGHGYAGYGANAPKFSINNGLMLLKSLLRGSKTSKMDSFHIGRKLGGIKSI